MAIGKRLSRKQHKLVNEAVQQAEGTTGLQFCVYLGKSAGDARAQAETMFVDAGMHERPAVLILVAPDAHKVEIVTAPDVRQRLSDESCAYAIDAMKPMLSSGSYDRALVTGLRVLADAAGPGESSATDLPNIFDG